MEIFLFIITVYSISLIGVYGSSLAWWRELWEKVNPSVLGKLFSCMMCLPFWVGVVMSYTAVFLEKTQFSPFYSCGLDVPYLSVFLDACLVSGTTFFIHTIQEWFENNQ
jgi:hypothetical protein